MNLQNTANTTLISSSSASLITAINDYATVISLSITLLGVLAGIFFHILALIDRRNHAKQMIIERRQQNQEVELERRNKLLLVVKDKKSIGK